MRFDLLTPLFDPRSSSSPTLLLPRTGAPGMAGLVPKTGRRGMATSGDERRKTERWRADDLEEAGRLGAAFGLGTVTGVIRQWSDRSGLIGCAEV